VPLLESHLGRLRCHGIGEVGINLHHLGQEILRHLETRAPDSLDLATFPENPILGAASAMKNASAWLGTDDLLVVENREPRRETPLQSEGDRIVGFGRNVPWPLAFTCTGATSGRLLRRKTSLVTTTLARGEGIGRLAHQGPFADLGRPSDFLGASLEALARGGSFPPVERCHGFHSDSPRR
jgi:hypothetical protein